MSSRHMSLLMKNIEKCWKQDSATRLSQSHATEDMSVSMGGAWVPRLLLVVAQLCSGVVPGRPWSVWRQPWGLSHVAVALPWRFHRPCDCVSICGCNIKLLVGPQMNESGTVKMGHPPQNTYATNARAHARRNTREAANEAPQRRDLVANHFYSWGNGCCSPIWLTFSPSPTQHPSITPFYSWLYYISLTSIRSAQIPWLYHLNDWSWSLVQGHTVL